MRRHIASLESSSYHASMAQPGCRGRRIQSPNCFHQSTQPSERGRRREGGGGGEHSRGRHKGRERTDITVMTACNSILLHTEFSPRGLFSISPEWWSRLADPAQPSPSSSPSFLLSHLYCFLSPSVFPSFSPFPLSFFPSVLLSFFISFLPPFFPSPSSLLLSFFLSLPLCSFFPPSHIVQM